MKKMNWQNICFMNKTMIRSGVKLVVLDISGVLCCKDNGKNTKFGDGLTKISCSNYDVYLRPYAKEFVKWCLDNYDVGIYSSTTYTNVNNIISKIFTSEQRKELKFLWCRDRCELDLDYGKDNSITEYSTVKNLNNIVVNPMINKDRKYTLKDILAIDDSGEKLRFNDKSNYMLIPSFELKPNCAKDFILEEITFSTELMKTNIDDKSEITNQEKHEPKTS